MIKNIELIDKNKIDFSPIKIYNMDEHTHKVTGMVLFKDIEKIPTIKAISIDRIKQVREEIKNLRLHKMEIGKPQSEICSRCFITNNILRCMTCKHKTKEWLTKCKATHPIILLGEHDNFKEKR